MATPRATERRPELVGAKSGCREYGLKYTSFRTILHRGEIPHIRIGRAMYVDRVDVENWIARQKQR